MKELDELQLPEDLGYTDDHEWARITGETVRSTRMPPLPSAPAKH